MGRRWLVSPSLTLAAFVFLFAVCNPAPAVAAGEGEDWRTRVAAGELVEVGRLDPTLRIELRYATARNGAGVALYPPDFPCLLRPAVARKLLAAQDYLRPFGCGRKIWDAYRPARAQRELWRRVRVRRYVADPDAAGGATVTCCCFGGHPLHRRPDFCLVAGRMASEADSIPRWDH